MLEELRESEEKYRTVVENASEAIIIAQDGMLKFVNPKAMEISGYSEEELLSRPFVEFIHPDDREKALDLHLKMLNGEETLLTNYQLRIIDKQGNIRWIETNAALIKWQGNPAALNMMRDITDLKKSRRRKRKSLQTTTSCSKDGGNWEAHCRNSS